MDKYFLLKNGARITSFKVDSKDLTGDLSVDIPNMLKIYPNGSEIYAITEEEHKTLHRLNLERRRLVATARKRGILYKNDPLSDNLINMYCKEIYPISYQDETDETKWTWRA